MIIAIYNLRKYIIILWYDFVHCYYINRCDFMRSEAQKTADKKYRMKKLSDGTKKQINATLNIEDYNIIDDYCNNSGISKAQLIVSACKEYINNHPLDEV